MNKTLNVGMIVIAAAVLVALNVGVFIAAGNGVISPINNMVLWGGFVALNIASILWAISLLGLQPVVVSISYVAGGALAYFGVRGMSDISVAEVTTAGATYGAFGALAIGNATTKVRLAFFNKGQVPFIFIIVGLLVVDAVLNSQISSAGTGVLLNAVLIPFAVAGVVIGVVWSLLNRLGIGTTPKEVLAAKSAVLVQADSVAVEAKKSVTIPMPERTVEVEKTDVKSAPDPKPMKKVEKVEPIAPAAKVAPAPVAKPEPVIEAVKKEKFFPLEIDKDDDILLPADALKTEASEPAFDVPSFDAELYASGSQDDDQDGGVIVKELKKAVAAKPAEPKQEVKQEVKQEKPAPAPKPAEKEDNGGDWLGGHLDLLNKLK
jgi:hypothetical protein